jgi:hypothetical protein
MPDDIELGKASRMLSSLPPITNEKDGGSQGHDGAAGLHVVDTIARKSCERRSDMREPIPSAFPQPRFSNGA